MTTNPGSTPAAILFGIAKHKLGLSPQTMAIDRRLEFYGLHRSWGRPDRRAAIRTAALNRAGYRAHNT